MDEVVHTPQLNDDERAELAVLRRLAGLLRLREQEITQRLESIQKRAAQFKLVAGRMKKARRDLRKAKIDREKGDLLYAFLHDLRAITSELDEARGVHIGSVADTLEVYQYLVDSAAVRALKCILVNLLPVFEGNASLEHMEKLGVFCDALSDAAWVKNEDEGEYEVGKFLEV